MTQTHTSTTRYDDEVLRCWTHQATRLQAAHEALWHYLESLTSPLPSDAQPELS